ncbi:MAG: hypothetical protein ACK4V2_03960 [Pseudomonadota bacterium]|jgi:hypothetical protein|nr:hypothetical protein [Alphaproteobacteria bacterium]
MKFFREVLEQKNSISIKNMQDVLQRPFEIIPSYPHIPLSNINPWDEERTFFDSPYMIHVRTRDFNSIEKFQEFLTQHMGKIKKNTYGLLVFGDRSKLINCPEIQPKETITIAKKYFSKVGVVVNPTPIIRSIKEELDSFFQKLQENPDFIITQCVYDTQAIRAFFKDAKVNFDKIYINLGYWNQQTQHLKLGISNPRKLTSPPQEIVNLAMHECQGIYVCGNAPELETTLQKQIENSQPFKFAGS